MNVEEHLLHLSTCEGHISTKVFVELHPEDYKAGDEHVRVVAILFARHA